MMGFLPDNWLPRRSPADDRRLFDDNGNAIRVPGSQDRPDDACPDVGRYEPPPAEPETASADPAREGISAAEALRQLRDEPDPGAANRRPDFPEPPDYSRRARGAVARIDAAIDENLRAANQRLRADLRAAIDRQRTVELERDTALARVAELELTLKALGRFVVHAAKHDADGGA